MTEKGPQAAVQEMLQIQKQIDALLPVSTQMEAKALSFDREWRRLPTDTPERVERIVRFFSRSHQLKSLTELLQSVIESGEEGEIFKVRSLFSTVVSMDIEGGFPVSEENKRQQLEKGAAMARDDFFKLLIPPDNFPLGPEFAPVFPVKRSLVPYVFSDTIEDEGELLAIQATHIPGVEVIYLYPPGQNDPIITLENNVGSVVI